MSRERGRRRLFRLRPQTSAEIERAVDDEIRAHLEMRVEALVRTGLTVERARAEALNRFGDVAEARRRLIGSMKERNVKMRRTEWFDGVRRDVRYALRHARRSPGYSLFAIGTLALGIGLTTATFTLVNGVAIRALPFPDADRLVQLQSADSTGSAVIVVSSGNWLDWREQNRTLESTAIHQWTRMPVLSGDEAARASVQLVSGGFFEVLRAPMRVGRAFDEAEAQSGAAVAVVGEGLWQSLFGGDPAGGRQLTVNGRAYEIVGVVAAGHEYPAGTDVWLPMPYRRETGELRNWVNWLAIARLRAGVSVEQADEDLDGIAAGIRATDPAGIYSWGVHVRPLKEFVVGDAARVLWLLMGAVWFVLVIACANLASVNVARGAARARDFAVRVALGAGRPRLIRELMIEHVVLALFGGAAGVALAWSLVRVVTSLSAVTLPRETEVALDVTVLAFAALVAVVSGVLTGILPALQMSRQPLRERLIGAGRGAVRGGRNLPGGLLVGFEVALALVLLTGGGLLVRSYRAVVSRDIGFATRDVVTASVSLAPPRTAEDQAAAVRYWEALLRELSALPGVEAAGAGQWTPLAVAGLTFIEIENVEGRSGAAYRAVSDDYFRALDIPMLAGRAFEPSDAGGSLRVAIVNRRMAEQHWPGENPLGKRVRAPGQESLPGQTPPWLTVVGVAGDIRHWGLEADVEPELYVGYRQVPARAYAMTALLRTSLPAATMMPAIRERIRSHDPRTPADLGTLQARLDSTLSRRQFMMGVLTIFSLLAVLLAAMGIYSLLSFAVSQRTREIAIRSALGARRGTVMVMVLRNAMSVVSLGMAIGLLAAFALTRVLTSMLVETSALDPLTFTAVTLFLLGSAFVAAFAPALRAASLDPLEALHGE